MSRAQKLVLVFVYASVAVLGATYAVFEDHQVNRLVHFINEMMSSFLIPSFLILVPVVVVWGFFRTAVSVRKELDGVSRAAHTTLHMDYGKKLARR
jgi:hypothetical protein